MRSLSIPGRELFSGLGMDLSVEVIYAKRIQSAPARRRT
jgi:hypothetical protein